MSRAHAAKDGDGQPVHSPGLIQALCFMVFIALFMSHAEEGGERSLRDSFPCSRYAVFSRPAGSPCRQRFVRGVTACRGPAVLRRGDASLPCCALRQPRAVRQNSLIYLILLYRT